MRARAKHAEPHPSSRHGVQVLPGRTQNGVKNHWHATLRKMQRAAIHQEDVPHLTALQRYLLQLQTRSGAALSIYGTQGSVVLLWSICCSCRCAQVLLSLPSPPYTLCMSRFGAAVNHCSCRRAHALVALPLPAVLGCQCWDSALWSICDSRRRARVLLSLLPQPCTLHSMLLLPDDAWAPSTCRTQPLV